MVGPGQQLADLAPGDLVWAELDPVVGREQAGRRPALVVAGRDYLSIVDTLAVVVPVTSIRRGWDNHVPIHGGDLPQDSWAMTEQVRAVSRDRIVAKAGRTGPSTLTAVRGWISDFLEL